MRLPARIAPALLVCGLAAFGPVAAHADKPKLHLERADVSQYPLLKLYLSFIEADGRVVTGKTKDDFKLIFDSNEQGASADAKPIEQTGEPVYMVIIAQLSGAMHEVFEDEKKGIKQLGQAAADIKGSKVALIGYAQDSKRIAELGKPEALDGALGGMQEDTEGTEVHLLDAVRTAIDLLNAKQVPDEARKLIVVFSDGIDVAGTERKNFTELGKRALLANIVIDTIGYAPFEPGKLRNLAELTKQTNGTDRSAKNAQDVGAQFSNVADEVKKEYVVLFRSLIAGDGKDHTIQVVNEGGGSAVYSNNVTKICENHGPIEAPSSIWKKWWFWLFCVALPIVGIIGLVMMLRGRRPAPEPEVAVAPTPEPSAQRTMALDIGVSSKGPTVGWIVGMSGKYVDRTFKLLPQRTIIGNSTEADISVEDPKVSRKHCEIRYDGSVYKIVDMGSTNGVVLNDKRIPQGELVDGDLFRLGATEFKFKSIN